MHRPDRPHLPAGKPPAHMCHSPARFLAAGRLMSALLLLVLTASGCRREGDAVIPVQTATTTPTVPNAVWVTLGCHPFSLEVAATNGQRQRGLQFRKQLPPTCGMIFCFARPQPLRFWMKDTEIPLDILYLDEAAKIVSIKQMEPFDLTGISSDGNAKFAIELNKGTAAKLGLQQGQTIVLPPQLLSAGEAE